MVDTGLLPAVRSEPVQALTGTGLVSLAEPVLHRRDQYRPAAAGAVSTGEAEPVQALQELGE